MEFGGVCDIFVIQVLFEKQGIFAFAAGDGFRTSPVSFKSGSSYIISMIVSI